MLGLIAKIKNWIKEYIEIFNEVEKFNIEHNLPNYIDCRFLYFF